MSKEEIHKLIHGTFQTELGKRCLEYLKETIVDRPSYKIGMELDEVAFREGQKNIITQLLKEME